VAFIAILASVIFVAADANGARAQGGPVALTPASWTGLYVGVHGGGAWSDGDWNFNPGDTWFNQVNPQHALSFDGNDYMVGGHVGYNYQIEQIVIGAELSYSALGIDDRQTRDFFGFPGEFQTSVDSLFLATGRLGYAVDKVLVYGKGGYASAEIKLFADDNISPDWIANTSERHDGWTVGGGVEYMLYPNVVLGVEYDYIDLGSERHTAPVLGQANGGSTGLDFDADVDAQIHAVSARLSIMLK
jgi:outer membrane immunogenic protein